MANPEHLEILEQGVTVWNRWRKDNISTKPDLAEAYLYGKNLSYADLNDTNLHAANLSWATLSAAKLYYANLADANLSKARLIEVDFFESNLIRADFTAADLQLADFTGAILYKANFTDVNVGLTKFTNIDLSTAIGLESIFHNEPSSIGIDTVYKSNGRIPINFLRGCGIPENFITYMHSLTGQALEFYKCFISFTEADNPFSERLYNDLQTKGVRCWRWKEDAKWGKTLMRSIDEAVRLYDKLIVICSEQSLNAPAVIREIERALQKEDEQARQGKEAEVLFPIRLDDYIFTGWNHHRKADVTAKNVGDFRKWKDHDSYQKAFDRLLRDLKAGE